MPVTRLKALCRIEFDMEIDRAHYNDASDEAILRHILKTEFNPDQYGILATRMVPVFGTFQASFKQLEDSPFDPPKLYKKEPAEAPSK